MIGFHGIGNSHMFEDEEMGNYHPEIENGDSNGDNETGIIGALGNKLEKTFKNSLSAMKSEHAEKVHPMTPERLARLQEAEKHPNETDFKNAAAWALKMLEKASL